MNGANDGSMIETVVLRLADFHVASTVVLAVALLVSAALRQPARRLALAWGACGAVALLVMLSMVPGWSVLHLRSASTEATPATEMMAAAPPATPIRPPTARRVAPPEAFAVAPVTSSPRAVAPTPAVVPVKREDGSATTSWRAFVEANAPGPLLTLATLGSLVTAAWLAWGSWVARRLVNDAAPADDRLNAMLVELAGDFNTTRTPRLLVSDQLAAAVAIGLTRPAVVLPRRMVAKATPADLRSVLAHELAHLSGGDLWLLAAMRVLLVALWPNPLFWLLRRRVRLDQETLADAAAAERTDRHAYAERLVGWARELSASSAPRGPRLAGAAGIWEGPSQLRSRVAVLLDERFTVLRRCGAAWRVACGLACATLAVGASLVTLSPAAPNSEATPPSEPEAVLADDAPRGTATLAGRIVFADGSPSTAKGWYYSGSQQENHSSYNTQGQLESRFECEVMAGVVNLRFFPDDGYAPVVAGPFELEPGDERRDLVVTLVPGYSSPLHLVDGQGEPVAGATVAAFPLLNGSTNGPVKEQETDAAGKLSLKHLAPGVPYVFRAKAAGYQPLRTEPLRMQNRANPVELTLLRARPATGVVRFVDGSVCPGAKLMTFSTVSPSDGANSYATPEPLAVADSEGRFTLDSLEDDAHHLILVEAMDQTRAFVTDIEAGDEGVQVVLPERHDLVVRVRGDLDRLPKRHGKPYVRVQQRVHADSVSELLTWEAAIEPLEGGNSEAIFRGLAIDLRPDAGPQEVQVSLPLDPPQSKVAPIARDADRATLVEFDLRPAGKTYAVAPGGQESLELAVRVVDEAGSPVAGAEVNPWALRSSQGHRTWWQGDKRSTLSPLEVTTDAEGLAEVGYPAFSDLDERMRTIAVSLSVDHPDYAFAGELHVDVPLEADAPYEVTLKRGATVELRPLVDGQPVATDGLHVLSSDSRAWSPEFELSTEDGLLRVPVMPAGPGVVRVVRLEGGRATRFSPLVSLDLKAGQTVRRDVELKPAVTIRGRLGYGALRPIRDGRVKASGLQPSREGPASTWFTWAPVAEDGTFEITGWPADETLQLIALCDGYLATNGAAPPEETETPDPDPYLRAHVFTPDQFDREVVLPMEPLVPCRVTAVDQAGDPVAGIEVASYPNVQWWNSGAQIYCDNLFRAERSLVTHDYRASIDREDTPEFNQTTDAEGVATLQLPKGRGSLYVTRSEAYELPIRSGGRRVDVELKPGEVTEARHVLQPKGTEQLGDTDKRASVPKKADGSAGAASETSTKALAEGVVFAPADAARPLTQPDAPQLVRGECLDAAGGPVVGGEVMVHRYDTRSGVSTLLKTTRTDDAGRFSFDNPLKDVEAQNTRTSDTYPLFLLVSARKAGLVSQTTAGRAADVERDGLHARFVMPAAATVRGRVVDPEGRPVEGALVSAELTNGISARDDGSIHSDRTDADGRYAIGDLPPSDFEALRREEERRRDAQLVEMKKTQAAGGASLDLFVSPTQRLITVTHPEYARTRMPLERAPGEVDVRMLAKAAVVGRVVDDAGDPVAGAGVMIATQGRNWGGEQPTPAEMAAELGRQYHARGLTDDAGRYRFDNLPAGDYGVQYLMDPERGRLPDRIPVGSVRVEAVASSEADGDDENEGATRAPDLRLTVGRLVRVQLVDDATGEPLKFDEPMAASVYFRRAGDLTGGVSNGETPVAADGTFTCRLLPEAGDLSVFQLHEKDRFESMSQWRTETTVRVTDEATLGDSVVRFPVTPGTVSLGWYIEEAGELASRGRPEEAIALLNEQLTERPADVSLLLKRAEIARGWGRDAEAIADYETLLQAAPDTWHVMNNLSDALVNAKDETLRDPPRALRLAEQALELMPEPHAMVLDTLAAAQAANGDLAAAIKTQERAIEMAPARSRPELRERLEAYQSRLP